MISEAERQGAISFDVSGVELGHQGAQCSFDAFLDKYRLHDPALDALARIVRGADTGRLELSPEAAGLLAISRGLSLSHTDDHQQIAQDMVIYDALYAWCRSVNAAA